MHVAHLQSKQTDSRTLKLYDISLPHSDKTGVTDIRVLLGSLGTRYTGLLTVQQRKETTARAMQSKRELHVQFVLCRSLLHYPFVASHPSMTTHGRVCFCWQNRRRVGNLFVGFLFLSIYMVHVSYNAPHAFVSPVSRSTGVTRTVTGEISLHLGSRPSPAVRGTGFLCCLTWSRRWRRGLRRCRPCSRQRARPSGREPA